MTCRSIRRRQRALDRRRLLRALNASLAFVLLLAAVFVAQQAFDWSLAGGRAAATGRAWSACSPRRCCTARPSTWAPTRCRCCCSARWPAAVYPRATLRALPLLWLGSGLGAWLLGDAGTHHLGASGLTHGLMFLVFVLGLLRRDRPAIAAAMIAFFLYGGMLLTVLPREPGVSWQAHLGGALAGVLAAWLFRRSDPQAPRKRYSWELEEELAAAGAADADREQFEPAAPQDVPVLWQRPPRAPVVLRFPRRDD